MGRKDDAFNYLKKGIVGGWNKKKIKKNKYLSKLQDYKEWKNIKKECKSQKKEFEASLNMEVRKKVKKMFNRDQWKAFGALFTFSFKGKDRYAEKKFASHSEKQMAILINILEEYGYPGERLLGNGLWMTVILSHHNSISLAYTQKDTIYPFLKPQLLEAIKKGEMSPYDYAIIEDWYITVKSDSKEVAYGYLKMLTEQKVPKSNKMRQNIGMRSIEIRNRLVDIQEKTGMDFYLAGSPWIQGKIAVNNKR